jgi:hypothetical protein
LTFGIVHVEDVEGVTVLHVDVVLVEVYRPDLKRNVVANDGQLRIHGRGLSAGARRPPKTIGCLSLSAEANILNSSPLEIVNDDVATARQPRLGTMDSSHGLGKQLSAPLTLPII